MFNKIKKNYFLLISTFLILYFFFNLIGGERGFFSYFKKKEILITLQNKEVNLITKIKNLNYKNSLLDERQNIERNPEALDYIERLIREKFLFGKKGETLYIIEKK